MTIEGGQQSTKEDFLGVCDFYKLLELHPNNVLPENKDLITFDEDKVYGDWRDEFHKNRCVLIKGRSAQGAPSTTRQADPVAQEL